MAAALDGRDSGGVGARRPAHGVAVHWPTSSVGVRPPAGGFERQAWFYMRASGFLLAAMAVGHLLYMHVAVGTTGIDYDWILQRWAHPVWRLYDWLMLAVALGHGANGVRTVLDDHVAPGVANTTLKWFVALSGLALLLMGSQVIVGAPLP